jgi:hypothetical protein
MDGSEGAEIVAPPSALSFEWAHLRNNIARAIDAAEGRKADLDPSCHFLDARNLPHSFSTALRLSQLG